MPAAKKISALKSPALKSPAFSGFVPDTLKFLKALGFHQSKQWFDENRDLYVSALKEPMAAYVEALSEALAARKIPLKGDPARGVFRLNRDIRFSKDKRPYKTNSGCVLTRTGAKNSPGLLYTHVSPEGCFFAAGFYHVEPEQLLAMRRLLAAKPDVYADMAKKLAKTGLALSDDEALTRNPREFKDVDPRVTDAIRMKSFVVRKPFDEKMLLDGGKLVAAAVDFATRGAPLLEFGWRVIP